MDRYKIKDDYISYEIRNLRLEIVYCYKKNLLEYNNKLCIKFFKFKRLGPNIYIDD